MSIIVPEISSVYLLSWHVMCFISLLFARGIIRTGQVRKIICCSQFVLALLLMHSYTVMLSLFPWYNWRIVLLSLCIWQTWQISWEKFLMLPLDDFYLLKVFLIPTQREILAWNRIIWKRAEGNGDREVLKSGYHFPHTYWHHSPREKLERFALWGFNVTLFYDHFITIIAGQFEPPELLISLCPNP